MMIWNMIIVTWETYAYSTVCFSRHFSGKSFFTFLVRINFSLFQILLNNKITFYPVLYLLIQKMNPQLNHIILPYHDNTT